MIQVLLFLSQYMLELNSQIADFFTSFWNLAFIPLFADGPIFFLPLFLGGMWIYYTFSPLSILSWKERWSYNEARVELMYIFYACIIGMILSYIIKQFVDIERPESYVESTKNMLLWTIPEKSFPSDHATISFAFVTALLYTRFYKIGYIFLPLVIIMNLCRIAVWVHWPLDILAGSLLWIFSAFIFFKYLRELKLVKSTNSIIIKVMKSLHLY